MPSSWYAVGLRYDRVVRPQGLKPEGRQAADGGARPGRLGSTPRIGRYAGSASTARTPPLEPRLHSGFYGGRMVANGSIAHPRYRINPLETAGFFFARDHGSATKAFPGQALGQGLADAASRGRRNALAASAARWPGRTASARWGSRLTTQVPSIPVRGRPPSRDPHTGQMSPSASRAGQGLVLALWTFQAPVALAIEDGAGGGLRRFPGT